MGKVEWRVGVCGGLKKIGLIEDGCGCLKGGRMGKKLKNDMSGRPHIEKIIHIHTFLQTLKFTSDLIQQSLMKAWKWYHLNGAGIMKPRIEDDVEVLQSAEENH